MCEEKASEQRTRSKYRGARAEVLIPQVEAHLKRSERTPHFGTAVSLGYLQMAAPALENLQFALECLQAPSVPGGEGPSVLTLTTGENIPSLEKKHKGFNRSLWMGC